MLYYYHMHIFLITTFLKLIFSVKQIPEDIAHAPSLDPPLGDKGNSYGTVVYALWKDTVEH